MLSNAAFKGPLCPKASSQPYRGILRWFPFTLRVFRNLCWFYSSKAKKFFQGKLIVIEKFLQIASSEEGEKQNLKISFSLHSSLWPWNNVIKRSWIEKLAFIGALFLRYSQILRNITANCNPRHFPTSLCIALTHEVHMGTVRLDCVDCGGTPGGLCGIAQRAAGDVSDQGLEQSWRWW